MKSLHTSAGLAVLALAVTSCTSGNTAVPPQQAVVNPLQAGILQFAVGTANVSGVLGLNTVTTLRKKDATSAALFSTPTIVGPAGFSVPAATDAGNDAGTASITGSFPSQLGSAIPPTTFGASGGVTGLGFQPDNSTTAGSAIFTRYALPFYAATKTIYLGGPPAFPQTRDGNRATGFAGFTLGFTDFAAAPVAGSYALSVQIPTGFDGAGNPTSGTLATSASLTNLKPLPTFAAPVFAPDGAGGGSVAVTVPAGVTEAYVFVVDTAAGATDCFPGTQTRPVYYAIRTTMPGTQTLVLPANVGPTGPGATSGRSICSGDTIRTYAAGFDYPVTAAAYPFSNAQTPPITGPNGQADVTTSARVTSTYP